MLRVFENSAQLAEQIAQWAFIALLVFMVAYSLPAYLELVLIMFLGIAPHWISIFVCALSLSCYRLALMFARKRPNAVASKSAIASNSANWSEIGIHASFLLAVLGFITANLFSYGQMSGGL
tara:strand:+ start:163 stop:528 length:366 start_codon:yes stop_codon:yes gene_type:complete